MLPAESSTRIMWQPTVSPPRWQGKANKIKVTTTIHRDEGRQAIIVEVMSSRYPSQAIKVKVNKWTPYKDKTIVYQQQCNAVLLTMTLTHIKFHGHDTHLVGPVCRSDNTDNTGNTDNTCNTDSTGNTNINDNTDSTGNTDNTGDIDNSQPQTDTQSHC